jgi:phosphoribosyl-ATP pyrophosphohydrolase
MTNLLILLSLVLNVIALFAIVILYTRQNRLLQVEKKQEKLINEMEEVISTYLIEMTEENEKLIKRVRETISQPTSVTQPTVESKSPIPSLEKKAEDMDTIAQPTTIRKGTVFQAVQAYKGAGKKVETESELETVQKETPPPLENKLDSEVIEKKSSDLYTQSFYYQALLLKKQGLSTEDIARRLNKGKTEIELLLKLRQNEQE